MAVKRVFQREIIELPYALPDGQILIHPALVISNNELQDYKDVLRMVLQVLFELLLILNGF